MARYDYGMRGFGDVGPLLIRGGYRAHRPWTDFDERVDIAGRTPRVAARYNQDYVFGARGQYYPYNYSPYAGDPRVPVMDEQGYHRPYMTQGGTWTNRGGGGRERYDQLYSGYYRGRDY